MKAPDRRTGEPIADQTVRCQVWFGQGFEKGPVGQCILVEGHKSLHSMAEKDRSGGIEDGQAD